MHTTRERLTLTLPDHLVEGSHGLIKVCRWREKLSGFTGAHEPPKGSEGASKLSVCHRNQHGMNAITFVYTRLFHDTTVMYFEYTLHIWSDRPRCRADFTDYASYMFFHCLQQLTGSCTHQSHGHMHRYSY